MAGYKNVVKIFTDRVREIVGVPVYHAPAPSAGEKVIYRYTPGSHDGDSETVTVTMRFISRRLEDAMTRAKAVADALCRRGERGIEIGGENLCVVREDGGGSGFIGRTGHFYVLSRFEMSVSKVRVKSEEGR